MEDEKCYFKIAYKQGHSFKTEYSEDFMEAANKVGWGTVRSLHLRMGDTFIDYTEDISPSYSEALQILCSFYKGTTSNIVIDCCGKIVAVLKEKTLSKSELVTASVALKNLVETVDTLINEEPVLIDVVVSDTKEEKKLEEPKS